MKAQQVMLVSRAGNDPDADELVSQLCEKRIQNEHICPDTEGLMLQVPAFRVSSTARPFNSSHGPKGSSRSAPLRSRPF